MSTTIDRCIALTEKLKAERRERILSDLLNLVPLSEIAQHIEPAMANPDYIQELRRQVILADARKMQTHAN
jgi:hypothetical protein